MIQRLWLRCLRLGVCVCILGLWGCGEDPQQLFDTAQFEEKQGNHTHAQQLYEQIIQLNPETDLAKKASERLDKLKN